ncbi:MAG: DNA replication/repair protein RecF [Oscillospiraceae bacterium]|jgi:DNA replication and repair protein RecF|nr:DNA replication/repair protein RecF [Oscillospiraceae bacterium]
MRVLSLRLKDFRNIPELDLSAAPGVNVIYGDNGQGKTNLIEGMWLCSGSKSFRGAALPQMIAFKKPCAEISMAFEGFGREQKTELRLFRQSGAEKAEKQPATLNGVKKRSLNALSGTFCAVAFSPAQTELINGGPEERRRFIDCAISQIRPYYSDLIYKYNRTLFHRNSLLRAENPERDLMAVWNESLAGFGASIINYRRKYIKLLNPQAAGFYSGLFGGSENLEISYQSIFKQDERELVENFDLKTVAALYRKKLDEGLEEDRRLGFTSTGVHRDDIGLKIDARSAKQYSSQGQKRSAVLALKLAESAILKNSIGEEPVIFLDDVLSELDFKRQRYILSRFEGKQVFITCCDRTACDALFGRKIFFMHGGTLQVEL